MTKRMGSHWDNCEESHHECALEKLRDCRAALAECEKHKDDAYAQRNRLAILLASLFGGRVMPATPPEPGWSSVLAFDLWTGQITFHLKDSEIDGALSCPGVLRADANDWDGHDDAEKWDRIARAACSALSFPVASATALASSQAREIALREALEWLRANPCCGAFTTAERSTGEAVVCGNCPHNAALVAEALSVPSSQDALREFGERVAVATSIAVGLPGALMVPGNSAAAIVASVLRASQPQGGSDA